MLRYGIISEVNYKTGRARVNFDDIDVVSGWLSLPNSKISTSRNYVINTQVAVLMHSNGEDGEIIHEVPSTGDAPKSWASESVEGVEFKDGTRITYDNDNNQLEITAGAGEIIFNCSKLTVNGEVKATGEITAMTITPATQVKLSQHLHTAPTGATGTPIPQP